MEVHGETEKGGTKQGLTIKMSLLLHSLLKEIRRRLGAASQQSKFSTQLVLIFSAV
jgi:hypothetical protein